MTEVQQKSNVIYGIDFTTITMLRSSISRAEREWRDDYRFQKGVEKEKELLKLFMARRS